jgi:hypothetical protein
MAIVLEARGSSRNLEKEMHYVELGTHSFALKAMHGSMVLTRIET